MNNWLAILLRIMSLFAIILILTRIIGKKNLYKINPFDFICYVIIAIITALIALNIITNIYFGLIALGILCILTVALDFIGMISKMIHDLINGKRSILIKNEYVMRNNLSNASMTAEEILQALRSQKYLI